MTRIPMAARAGALALALAMALPAAAQETAPVSADTVVATVNGTDITVGHMLVLRTRLPQQYQSLSQEVLFNGILDQLIEQEVLRGASGGISSVGRLMLDNEERALIATETARALAAERVTDADVQARYEEAIGTIEPTNEYNAAHILVETEEEALAIVAELEGGAEFAALAAERSGDPGSAQQGGTLGWFGKGMMVAPFEQAVLALAPGETSAPVQTDFGWHVIRLNEIRPVAVPTLEDIGADIRRQLEQEAIEAAIAELRETADISRVEPGEIDPSVIGDATLLQD